MYEAQLNAPLFTARCVISPTFHTLYFTIFVILGYHFHCFRATGEHAYEIAYNLC